MSIDWESKAANFARVERMLDAAEIQPGSLILLPEMFATGFSMNVSTTAEPADGPTRAFLVRLALRHQIYLVGGVTRPLAGGMGSNQLDVIAPDGSCICTYAKIHPFSFGEESKHFIGGDAVHRFQWHESTVSPFICYDLRFPEIFRQAALGGAEIFLLIANWPAARQPHWIALARARAIENQAFIACVNRIGADPQNQYAGGSMILSPHGDLLADAGDKEQLINAEIDLTDLRAYRKAFPVLKDAKASGGRP